MRSRSTKVISEEITAQALKAKSLYNRVKSLERDFTDAEWRDFNSITDKRTGTIARLEIERAQAEQFERQILNQSRNNLGANNMSVSNQSNPWAPQPVLPVNGVVPADEKPRYAPHRRMGKLRAFADEQSAFDSGMWLKAVVARSVHGTVDARAENYCARIGLEITNVGTEGSGVSGGYLTPAPLSSAIIEIREKVGVSRQIAQVLPMSGDSLTVPKRAGGLQVTYPGEAQAIADSDKSWSQVAVAAKKRAVLSYLSQELVDDAVIDIADNLVAEMAYSLALREDDEIINGDGTSAYGGIRGLLQSVGSAGVHVNSADDRDAWGEFTMVDLLDLMAKLPDRFYAYGPAFVTSHSFYNSVMARLAYAAGGVTASEVLHGTSNVRQFLGHPVYLTSAMPTTTGTSQKCCIFGAFRAAVLLGDRGGIRISRSDDFRFSEDLIALRAVARYDANIHEPGDGSNAGAYVCLATNS